MSNKVTIRVNINNTIYPVTCEMGEEDNLLMLQMKLIERLKNYLVYLVG